MLNPGNDRLDYGQVLTPPVGFEIDFAIGTTYSLDLDALVGACLAMGLSEETDSDLMNNPVYLLEALRSTGDKVALFCESGQIHMPSNVTSLYILLEKIVFSVKPPRRKGNTFFPSFHPKFWLIRYKNKKQEIIYRVIILSRNLTFDRSWDVTFYMDGYLNNNQTDKNEPICDFLDFLQHCIPKTEVGKEKDKRIKAVINELPYVHFELAEKEFYDYCFIPSGVKRKADEKDYLFSDTPLFKENFHELMVISPFVSGDIIRNFNCRNDKSHIENPRYMLITRKTSLDKLKPEDVTRFKLFALKNEVIDGETDISGGSTSTQKQDIHAKIYMMRKYADSSLYLGSLNASHNAVYGNVEFMICLRAKNRYLNMDRLTASLFGEKQDGSENPFQEIPMEYILKQKDDNHETDLGAVVKNISRSRQSASVNSEDGEHYNISMHFGVCDTRDLHVSVRPLLYPKQEYDFAQSISFDGLELTQLSEFYVVTVTDGEHSISRVLTIPTEGIPENREKAVVSGIVSNRECFYRYITFLLGDDSILSALEVNSDGIAYGNYANKPNYDTPALYEKMLQAAATDPQKFKGIEYMMKSITDDEIIPDDFKALYLKFMKVVKLDA